MDEPKEKGKKESLPIFFMGCLFVIINGFALLLSHIFIEAGMEVFEQADNPMNLVWVFITVLGMTLIILLIAKFWKKRLIQLIILFAVGYTSFYIFLPLFSLFISNWLVTVFISIILAICLVAVLLKYPEWYIIDLCGIIIGAGFFTLIRVLILFTNLRISIGQILIIMALITMTVGNLMAFGQFTHKKQVELKRILAYSSIAQMGYVILGVGVGIAYSIDLGYTGGLFHIMTHAFMKGLAFLCAGVFIHYLGTKYIDEMQGIGITMKLTGFAFVLSLLSLAGIPPLSGFMSEWMIFGSSIMTYNFINLWGIAIAAIALINTLIALGYYLPIIKIMYLSPEKQNVLTVQKPSKILMIAITILAALTILLGVWPELGLRVVKPDLALSAKCSE